MEKNVDRITGLWMEEKNKVNIAVKALKEIDSDEWICLRKDIDAMKDIARAALEHLILTK